MYSLFIKLTSSGSKLHKTIVGTFVYLLNKVQGLTKRDCEISGGLSSSKSWVQFNYYALNNIFLILLLYCKNNKNIFHCSLVINIYFVQVSRVSYLHPTVDTQHLTNFLFDQLLLNFFSPLFSVVSICIILNDIPIEDTHLAESLTRSLSYFVCALERGKSRKVGGKRLRSTALGPSHMQ